MASALRFLLLLVVFNVASAVSTCPPDADCLSVAGRITAAVAREISADPARYVAKECAKAAVSR